MSGWLIILRHTWRIIMNENEIASLATELDNIKANVVVQLSRITMISNILKEKVKNEKVVEQPK